jgi:hypothetical protein
VKLIESFLKDRTTTLRLGMDTSAPFRTSTGITQGSPLSSILYLFYNADLLQIGSRPDLNTCTSGYIDDLWTIENLRRKGIRAGVTLGTSHMGIEGNERADKAAKEATGWRRIRNRG